MESPALAKIFMCSFECTWLQDCSYGFKPVFCRRCVDDIFVKFFLTIMEISLKVFAI